MEIISYLLVLIFSTAIHEYMHAFTSFNLGDTTAHDHGRLSFNPLRHIDPFFSILMPAVLILSGSGVVFGAAKPVPFNPNMVRGGKNGAALVAISGPLSNLLIALVAGTIFKITGGDLFGNVMQQFVYLNLGFFVFNLIPFPPLDGSRVLYAFAPEPVLDVMDKIEQFGIMGVFAFLFLAYPIIGGFVSFWVDYLAKFIL